MATKTAAVKKTKVVPSATPQNYDPLAPSYKSTAELQAAAHKQAQTQLQPVLDANTAESTEANAASATRQNQLQGWYGWANDKLKGAFDNATAAANNLIASRSGATRADQDVLAAALRGQSADQGALATRLGGAPPPSQDAAVLAAAAGNADAANRGIFDTTTAQTLGAGERVGTAAIGGLEASRTEQGRLSAILKQLGTERKSTVAQLPGLESQALTQLSGTEEQKAVDSAQIKDAQGQLANAKSQLGETKANRLFQEWLATQQLSDDRTKESFSEWLSKQQLGQSQQQISETARHNKATEATDLESITYQLHKDAADTNNVKAQSRAKAWDNGVQWLNSYIAPGKAEGAPHQKVTYSQSDVGVTVNPYTGDKVTAGDVGTPILNAQGKPAFSATATYTPRSYNQALRTLTGQYKLGKSDALRLLKVSDNLDFRKQATDDYNRLKRRLTKSKVDPLPKTLTGLSSANPLKKK